MGPIAKNNLKMLAAVVLTMAAFHGDSISAFPSSIGFFQAESGGQPLPGNPSGLSATPQSPFAIYLSWTSGGGSTVDFKIAWQTGATAPATCDSGTTITTTNIYKTITSLTANTQYSFRLCARNGNDPADYSATQPTVTATTNTAQRIFITNAKWNGNLGGLGGADSKCQAAADGATPSALGGTWKALISVAGTNVKDRLNIAGDVANLRPAGSGGPQVIVTSAADTWDSSIAVIVSYDESGAAIVSTDRIWSGSYATGLVGGSDHCQNFTDGTNSYFGYQGRPDQTTGNWISIGTSAACNGLKHLYCVDGQEGPPMAPVSQRAVPRTNTQIDLYWVNQSSGVTNEIERSANGSTGWTTVATTAVDAVSYSNTGLSPGATWFYRIRSVNDFGPSGWSGNATTTAREIQRVFVTAGTQNGNLGGLNGANATCQSLATTASLGGNWQALLSGNGVNAKDNFVVGAGRHIYNLRNPSSLGPLLIATSSADMWDSSIGSAIEYDQNGALVTTSTSVWAGSTAAGVIRANDTCLDWTSASGSWWGWTGYFQGTNGSWIDEGSSYACSSSRRLYCIESLGQPNMASNLRAVPRTDTQINLYWSDNSDNETGFEIERSPDGSSGWSLVQTTAADVITWSNTGLAPGATWFYRIRAVNGNGNSNFSPNASTTARNIQRVFVTASTNPNGNLGGLAGANGICQAAASGASLGGNWQALVSSNGVNIKDNFNVLSGHHLYNTRGPSLLGPLLVATSTADMWDNSISNAIQYDQNGALVTTSLSVWTGSTNAGVIRADNCIDWTSTSGSWYGWTGSLQGTNGMWIDEGSSFGCGSARRIYCAEALGQPNMASNLRAVPRTNTQIDLYWSDNSDNETGFEIERSPDGSTGWTLVQTAAANAITWSNTGLISGATWHYRIRAVNGNGASNFNTSATTTARDIQRIFVTAGTYNGGRGGLVGADTTCQSEATTAGLGGTWQSLLSGNGVSAKDNLIVGAGNHIYNTRATSLLGPLLVGTSGADIWDSSISNEVQYDQNGALVTTSTSVWTGSTAAGVVRANDTCLGWTSTSGSWFGWTGYYQSKTGMWFDESSSYGCGTLRRMYCVETLGQPNMASNLRAVPRTDTQIDLYWSDNSANETGFEIERSANGSTGWSLINTTAADVQKYSDSGLSTGETWFYRVRSKNAVGNSVYTANATTTARNINRIFVTSSTFAGGNLGGLTGADSSCQSAATTAGLGGTWKAVLSSSAENASGRTTIPGGNHVYSVRSTALNGPQLIATTQADLWDGTIATNIEYDENGSAVPSNKTTWAGSTNAGIAQSSGHCSNWTATSGTGFYGDTNSANSYWINDTGGGGCGTGTIRRIYCLEQ